MHGGSLEIRLRPFNYNYCSGLSSSLLVAEACRDYERGSSQPPGPQHQEQQQKKPVLQKQNSGSGGVRLPPPYQAPPGAYQPPSQGGYQGQKAYIGQSGGSGGHAHQQQPNPTSSTSPNQEVITNIILEKFQ